MDWNRVEKEIDTIFSTYVTTRSYTGTFQEKEAETFLAKWFEDQDYFRTHPNFRGKHPLPEDPLGRHVVWGMVRGSGSDTVVLIHHYDVVDTSDFGAVEPWAHHPDEIRNRLMESGISFEPDVQRDLTDQDWIFGRGTADMKAGGSIQMALLNAFTREETLSGNILLCCLPDEENLSAGMRAALTLLDDLKSTYDLNYRLMIDSEPHERENPDTGVIYEGSVGKLMPFVYARGVLAHTGRIFEGLNPIHLLSELVIRTELNMDFSEEVDGEVLPPPSWLYFKDGKEGYDVSIPIHASAYMNTLTLELSPDEVLAQLIQLAEQAFEVVLERVDASHTLFLKQRGMPKSSLPWKPRVLSFSQLYDQVHADNGSKFESAFKNKLTAIKQDIDTGSLSLMEASFAMVEFCLAGCGDTHPVMVVGLSPPYYPNVCNDRVENLDRDIRDLVPWINQYTLKKWRQPYSSRKYFTGISDLSYAYPPGNQKDFAGIAKNMPLWGPAYTIPFDAVSRIRMPCVNIGPWGKDLHKFTERVNKTDLFERTPKILYRIIRHLLK